MREPAFVSAALLRIPVLIGWMAVPVAMFLLLLNPQNVEAQVGRDLTINISQAGIAPAIPTQTNVAFVITASNIQSGSASNVLVSVLMPGGFTSFSATPEPASGFSCSFVGSKCSCTTATLAGNTQKTFRISATAPSTISGTSQSFTLTGQIDPNNTVSESDNGNNSDNFTVSVVTRADLDISLTASPGLFTTQVTPNLVYVVTAKNTGDREAPNLLVRSTLPKDVAFVRVEENQLGTCLQNSSDSSGALHVNCTLSSLPAGASRHVRIIGKILGSIPDGFKVTFAANADPNNSVPERNETNNTAFMVTTVRVPVDLQVTGTVVESESNAPGSFPINLSAKHVKIFKLQLSVKNNGPNPSTPTTVRTDWPSGIVASTNTQEAACFDSCPISALNSGQTIAVTVTGIIVGPFQCSGGVGGKCPTPVQVIPSVDPDQTLFDSVVSNNKVTLTILLPSKVTF